MSDEPRRVVLFSASVGSGHVRAAEAIESALKLEDAEAEIEHVDVLDLTSRAFRRLYAGTYLDLLNLAPELWGMLHERTNRMPKRDAGDRLRVAIEQTQLRKLVRLLNERRPHAIASTHFLPAEIVSHLVRKGRVEAPQAVVITDYDVHSAWVTPEVARYFVAREENRVHLEAYGVDADRIEVTGIPILPDFSRPADRNALAAQHGLDPDRPLVLVLCGGFGIGPVGELAERLLPGLGHAQAVLVAGRNEVLRARLEKIVARSGADARVLGFTTVMHEWMALASLVVTKPGGLTSSESLARGLPLVIVTPIPGQERSNATMLYEAGAAISGENPWTLGHRVGELLKDPHRLERMRQAALRLGRPHAAREVARGLLQLANR